MSGRGRGRGRGRGVPKPEPVKNPGVKAQLESLPNGMRELCLQTQPGKPGYTQCQQSSGNSSRPPPIERNSDSPSLSPDLSDEDLALTRLPSHLPQRPQVGTLGRRIGLIANYYEITFPEGQVFHYDVEIMAKRDYQKSGMERQKALRSPAICREVMKMFFSMNAKNLSGNLPAFDGRRNMYAKKRFPFDERTFEIPLMEDGRKREYMLTVKYATTIDFTELKYLLEGKTKTVPQNAIQALDIILRAGPAFVQVPVGRSFFTKDGYTCPFAISGGREVWFGYHSSIRPTSSRKMMLNINLTATTFHEAGCLVKLICKILGNFRGPLELNTNRELDARQIAQLNKELKNVKVTVNHLTYQRKYAIKRITKESARKITFKMDDGSVSSVADYFALKYSRLRYPNMPCVQSGTASKPVYIPVEVCDVVENQPCRSKTNDIQTSDMIRKTAIPPADRFRGIDKAVKSCVSDGQQYLEQFSMSVSMTPVHLQARVLPAPDIEFRDDIKQTPRDGVWNLEGNKFYSPSYIQKWVVINCSVRACTPQDVNTFVRKLADTGRSLGMGIERNMDVIQHQNGSIKNCLIGLKKKIPDLQFALVILGKKSPLYSELKATAEVDLDLITQCVVDQNITNPKKCNGAFLTNVLQKVNSKMGGVNSQLHHTITPAVFEQPVIIIGADVTHPAPNETQRPSIAAAVGSLNNTATKYRASVRVQKEQSMWKARVEVIKDLKDMVKELLVSFYKATRQKPEKIIFYRDGVSEGQFFEVRNYEVNAVKKACSELSGSDGYDPALTFLTVQKRHHTRFHPQNFKDGVGKCKNVPPGTTVDTTITHPVDFDFFLCSHYGIQGTSRPTHYYVLWDESNFSADELQKLSYYLCHTYARCARSVSIPTPVYYAHLAAFRAKEHLNGKVDINSASSDSSGFSDDSSISTESFQRAVDVSVSMKGRMYFV